MIQFMEDDMDKFGKWFEDLGQNMLHLFDQRILVMLAILLVAGYFLIGPEQWALIKTGLQLTLVVFVAGIISLLMRKLILHNAFDLQEMASASTNSTGAAIVFAAVMAFQFGIIVLVAIKLLP